MCTIKQLDKAIQETIWPNNAKAFEKIKEVGAFKRYAFHKNACICAFIRNEETENAKILRWAMQQIEKTGRYPESMFEN
jgi:hypothetical protein